MKYTKIITGVVGAAVLVGAAYYLYSSGTISFSGGSGAASAPSPTETPAFDLGAPPPGGAPAPLVAEPRTPPAGYLEYRSDAYHFSLFYPNNLTVKTYDEGGGASTITFQNIKTAEGFQLYITPYGGTQISEQQFKRDEPSGVRTGVQNVTVGGVPAVSFYSTNPALGDTAEVWFIRGGYLYEATSLKPLASWFSNIMQTWQFTQ